MDAWSGVGIALVLGISPLVRKFITPPFRRMVKRMPEGRLRTLLLLPVGYTKKQRDRENLEAVLEDAQKVTCPQERPQ
jgi:hypothetical protein